jgi:formate dehydrogenase subunit gamma
MEESQTLNIGKPVGKKPDYIVRFNVRQRIEHILLMVIFVMLALTGLIQKFYTAAFCQWIILNLGGITTTRWIHRGFAMVFVALMVYHIVLCLINVFGRHKKATMVPTLNDYKAVVADLKCHMGMAAECPKFGRYDYRQKFEYFGLIIGSIIIIISGFILLFPTAITSWIPGDVIPVALTFHGWEATLAVIVIVIWHIYDVVLRPDIFPTDKSIFTGKISLQRLKEEHGLEYEEITGEKADE